jgi:uncharacterized phage protein (TIGR02218 family)
MLNRPLGRVYQKPCSAVLGDASCKLDTLAAEYSIDLAIEYVDGSRIFRWGDLGQFVSDWFTRGRLEIRNGPAAGLWGTIKRDRREGAGRTIELWEPVRAPLTSGVIVRLVAGCDKRGETCRRKFNNLLNFQGFPDLPGDDWLMAVPKSTGANTGGSRR